MTDAQNALYAFKAALVSELSDTELAQIYRIKNEIMRTAGTETGAGELAMTLVLLEFAIAQEKKLR